MFTFEIISFASFVVFFIISAIFSVGAKTENKYYWYISIDENSCKITHSYMYFSDIPHQILKEFLIVNPPQTNYP